jgi:hypothetical protein
MAARHSPSIAIAIRVPRPRLVSRPILRRTLPGRCRARFAMSQDLVVTLTHQVSSPKLALTLGPPRRQLPITANVAIATAVKVVQKGSKVSPTALGPVPALWVSLARHFLSSCLHNSHHTLMTLFCISQLGAICDSPRCTFSFLSFLWGRVERFRSWSTFSFFITALSHVHSSRLD